MINFRCKPNVFSWLFHTFDLQMGYPSKQSDADHSNRDGCQIITLRQGNSSKSLNFR